VDRNSGFKYDDYILDSSIALYGSSMEGGWIGNCYDSRSNNKKIVECNNRFFKKPSIRIGELKPIDLEVKIRHSQEIFQGFCWVLPIVHEKWKIFSVNTSDCHIVVNITENDMTKFNQAIPLYWRRGKELPEECRIDMMSGTDISRHKLASGLPFAYMYALAHITSVPAPLSKGGKDESLFLFTYPEGRGMYIIPALSITKDQDHDQTDHYLLSYNTKYDVRIKFHSKEYDSPEERFSLFAKSWNDVLFGTHLSEWVHKYWHCRRCPCLAEN
jgi:hypothetical protein